VTVQGRLFHARAPMPETERLAGELYVARQNERILAWLRARPLGKFTPWEISEALGICVNSVRRACTDMTHSGDLARSENRVESGPYRKKSYMWGVP
jgi:hypothetical protein